MSIKTLTTDQQIELQALLEETTFGDFPAETRAKLRYWAIELKPKRVRKKNIMGDGGTVLIDGGTTFVENSVDNTVEV